MKTCALPFVTLCALAAAQAPSATAAARLPVTELTAFKDGHAFVLRSGAVPLPADGKVRLDDLPKPVLGTFWPAVGGDAATLRSVTAGQRRVVRERTALDLRQHLQANLGKRVVVRETGDIRYEAVVVDLPRRPAAELDAEPGRTGPQLPELGDVVLLRTETTRRDTNAERIADAGTRWVRLDRIVDLTFLEPPAATFADETIAPQLVLDIEAKGERPATVPVQLGWVEQGFRWIPSYRVVIDGAGSALVRLQATLVNDLVDLEGAAVHLVVGVPSFANRGQFDPIALQDVLANALAQAAGQSQQFFGNAMMSQVAYNMPNVSRVEPGGSGVATEVDEEGQKHQDLYVFTVAGVTLRRHERMVVTLGETTVAYRDVWKLDVPMLPPQELWEQVGNQGSDLAKLLAQPKVRHEIRLENRGKAPFTTAPALVLQGGQVLAQGTMTYTPAGASCDLALTSAIDIGVTKEDREVAREPNAVRWNNSNFLRIDLEGKVVLRNRRTAPVDIEVRRTVFGKLVAVDAGGAMVQLNAYDDEAFDGLRSGTWRRHPHLGIWSLVLNGVGRASWQVHIEPGQEATVACSWQYYWQ